MEMDDVIYKPKKRALILIMFQDSTLLGCIETSTGSFVNQVSFISLKCVFL